MTDQARFPDKASRVEVCASGGENPCAAGIGHLEKFKVPARVTDAPPFSSAQALENEAKRKSQFPLCVLKNPKNGIFQGPLYIIPAPSGGFSPC
jgi:hypothetical protein